jgi:anti-sigma regulatory factor (Ser/Thr protein kinase)
MSHLAHCVEEKERHARAGPEPPRRTPLAITTRGRWQMPAISWQRVFPGEASQLAALRQWLAALLPACPARDDLAVVATELGANAIQHTASGRGGRFAVQVSRDRALVRVAVTDGGAATGPRIIEEPGGERGRGLRLVEGLSAGMGVSGDHRGRRVWADIAWGDAVIAGTASPQPGEEAVGRGPGSVVDGRGRFGRTRHRAVRAHRSWVRGAAAGGIVDRLLARPAPRRSRHVAGRD